MNEYGIDLSQDRLNDLFEIEQALSMMKDSDEEQSFLKDLKKRRVNPIDDKIKKLETDKDKLKKMILNTMKELKPKQKTIDFPGVAKVTRRAVKGTWSIVDEDSLIADLERLGLKDDIVKVEEKIDKKKLNSALVNLEKQSSVVSGVEKSDNSESISVSFSKETPTKETPTKEDDSTTENREHLRDLLV